MSKGTEPILNNLKSILKLSANEVDVIFKNGQKYFLKTKTSSFGPYGGYSRYFEDLSRGKYKGGPDDFRDGGGGPRSLNFNIKHILTAEKILLHPKPLRVLDLGCSSGFLRRVLEANVFSPQDIYYYGVDIRANILEKAVLGSNDIESGALGDNIPSLYINYDFKSSLPFRDNVFDFVVSFEAIKYLKPKEARKLFGEISRVLKDGKIFIYSTAGIFENEKMKEDILKVKTPAFYLWNFDELKKSLEASNLFLGKTYGAEVYHHFLQRHIEFKNNTILSRMENLYPKELIAAILGPFHHEGNHNKLFFISKGKTSLLSEVENMFPGEKVLPLKHRGNSEIFVTGDKIIKYLPGDKFRTDKYLEVHKLLKEQTDIRLPKLIRVLESGISENYIFVMEKIKDNLLQDVWDDMPEQKRATILHQLVSIMKQMHSIHLNFNNAQPFFKLAGEVSNWKESINKFCLAMISQYEKRRIVGKDFCDFSRSILKQNIDYIDPRSSNFIHRDFNKNNLTVDKNLNLGLMLDFESCLIGDKYLDLVIAGAYFGGGAEKMIFDLYGTPDNFDKISKVYRLVLFLSFLHDKKMATGKRGQIKDYIERGGNFSPLFIFK